MGSLAYHNAELLIFPDYAVETQKMQRSFHSVKAAMRTKGITYSILFLAKLRVVDGETVRFFTTLKDTSAWLEVLPPRE